MMKVNEVIDTPLSLILKEKDRLGREKILADMELTAAIVVVDTSKGIVNSL